jgi:hypothetical protein
MSPRDDPHRSQDGIVELTEGGVRFDLKFVSLIIVIVLAASATYWGLHSHCQADVVMSQADVLKISPGREEVKTSNDGIQRDLAELKAGQKETIRLLIEDRMK